MSISGPITITVLGSGTSVGVPTIGCPCSVCHSDDPRDRRLRPSILVSFDAKGRRRNIVIDTTPDFRIQALTSGFAWLDAILYTHAHADHALPGSRRYLATTDGAAVLRQRLDPGAAIRTLAYGEHLSINGVDVSLHPAGHILGSAQVRVEHRGEVWVVSGDYKTGHDATCAPFEVVPCHTFITEATFGLPIYRWPAQADVFAEINAWWRKN